MIKDDLKKMALIYENILSKWARSIQAMAKKLAKACKIPSPNSVEKKQK